MSCDPTQRVQTRGDNDKSTCAIRLALPTTIRAHQANAHPGRIHVTHQSTKHAGVGTGQRLHNRGSVIRDPEEGSKKVIVRSARLVADAGRLDAATLDHVECKGGREVPGLRQSGVARAVLSGPEQIIRR